MKADAVVHGYTHSCALRHHSVKCWGFNRDGQLGLGDTTNRYQPEQEAINFGASFVPEELSCGWHHCCVLSMEHSLKCWGLGASGRLGYEDSNNRGDQPNEMGDYLSLVNLPSGFVPKLVSASGESTCALSHGNSMVCWGKNENGELGLGHRNNIGDHTDEMGDHMEMTHLGETFGSIAQIEGMLWGFCARSTEGEVKCWGRNVNGNLGLGDTNSRGYADGEMGDALPITNLGTQFVVDVLKCGWNHCCAMSLDGVLKCWGTASRGRLGYGDTNNRGDQSNEMGDYLLAVSLGAGFVVREFECAGYSTCAISTVGVLKCWGWVYGLGLALGDNNNHGDDSNEMGDYLPAVNYGSGFSASGIHVAGGLNAGDRCIFEDSSTALLAKCFGWNQQGQLGYGDTTQRGRNEGEMGDNLPFVSFGAWPAPPPSEPVCDADDMVKVDWHDMLNENEQSPSLLHSESVAFEASTLSLTFSASLEYVGKSADGNFDDAFNLGTTYWIDFQSFSSVDGGVDSAGSCTNRRSADYSGLSFADLWTFPVNPADLDSANTEDRMAYPPSDWTLSADDCTTIEYERTLSWAGLTACQDAAGNPLISVEDTPNALKLSGTFFVELVSPYSMSTEGYFRTFPVVQQGFEIVLNKQVDVMATTGVQLFIPSVMAFARNDDDGGYEVTVLIQSADYVSMSLDDVAAVTGPLAISSVEAVTAGCLVASSFTCGQIFTVKLDEKCPVGGGPVILSGSYQFAFTPQCRLLDDGTTTDPACDTFLTTLDESAGKVALGVDVDFEDECAFNLFNVSFQGTLSFYSDDQFAVAVDSNSAPFVIGQDTIFGKVTVAMATPGIQYQLSGVTIETVYVCTAAPGADLTVDSSTGLGGCLSANIDADGPYNVIGAGAVGDYQGASIDTTEPDEARFSFLTFDTPRTDIHIHVQALLDVTFETGGRRRVRMLLQNEEGEANQFRSFVGTASVQQDEDGQSAARDDLVGTDGAASGSVGFVVAMIVFTAAMMG